MQNYNEMKGWKAIEGVKRERLKKNRKENNMKLDRHWIPLTYLEWLNLHQLWYIYALSNLFTTPNCLNISKINANLFDIWAMSIQLMAYGTSNII